MKQEPRADSRPLNADQSRSNSDHGPNNSDKFDDANALPRQEHNERSIIRKNALKSAQKALIGISRRALATCKPAKAGL